jgi:Protein of unknown function (DUF3592)
MRFSPTRLSRVLLAVAVLGGLMLIVGFAVSLLYPDDWRPVAATVRASHIESTRPGTVQWTLMVDAAYVVDGRAYETNSDVFRDSDRAVTEAEAGKWPAGRTFMLYVDTDNPRSVSLVPDGGREAATVTAVILTPLLVIMIGFVVLLARQVRGQMGWSGSDRRVRGSA